MNDATYLIDVEAPEAATDIPPPDMDTIMHLLHAGKLTAEMTIDGRRASFVLRPVEERD